jgi:hypothetical protein
LWKAIGMMVAVMRWSNKVIVTVPLSTTVVVAS